MSPRVEIVIPCWEQVEFLPEALESALAQGAAVDRVVVVDDGSAADVRGVARRFPGVGYVRLERSGVSAARNAGLSTVGAPHVLFLDADDRLAPGAVEAHLACFARHPDSGFVFGAHRFIARDGRPLGTPGSVIPPEPDYLGLVRQNYIGMMGNVLFRTAAVREAGGFDEGLVVAEDYELMLRVARRHPIRFHDAVVADYRRYDTSASANATRMLPAIVHVLERERLRAGRELGTDPAFDEGLEFFKLFYAVRVVRQAAREAVLERRPGQALSRLATVVKVLGPRLAFLRLPPAVVIAAVRKIGDLRRGRGMRRADGESA